MRAMLCHEWGTPDTLELSELPTPVPEPGQVLVDLHAAALNFADTLIIAGKYQERPEHPFAPGVEAAGVVTALGEGVAGLHVVSASWSSLVMVLLPNSLRSTRSAFFRFRTACHSTRRRHFRLLTVLPTSPCDTGATWRQVRRSSSTAQLVA